MARRRRTGTARGVAVRICGADGASAERTQTLTRDAPGPVAGDGEGDTVVERWFGDAFAQLHPLLQSLHRQGGILRGRIAIDTGHGFAGLIGRRLARRLGIPLQCPECGFVVRITHQPDALLWRRGFDDGAEMRSTFVPYGHFPAGGWHERTGPLLLDLGVDTRDGGWQWHMRGARWHGMPIPRALLPQAQAGKRIVEGRYAFDVDFRVPLLGRVLRYSGLLDVVPPGLDDVPLT